MALRFLPFQRTVTALVAVAVASVVSLANAAPTPPPSPAKTLGAKAFTKSPGAFYVTLPDGTKLPLDRMHIDVTGPGVGSNPHSISVWIEIADADATAFLSDAIEHANVAKLVVTSPKAVMTFTNVIFASYAQNSVKTRFPISARAVSITGIAGGRTFSADTTSKSPVGAQESGKPSTSVSTPNLTIASIGTVPLVSDTFTISRPVDAATGSSTGKSSTNVAVQFSNADGLGLAAPVLDNTDIKTAILTTSAGAFDIHNVTITSVQALFDASGTPAVSSTLSFANVTPHGATTLVSADRAKFKLTLPGGTTGKTSIALVAAAFGLTHPIASTGSGSLATGKTTPNLATFTIADSNAMPFILDVMNDKNIPMLVVSSPDASIAFTNVGLTKGTDTSTSGGGSATFSITYQNATLTVGGKTTSDDAAASVRSDEKATAATSVAAPNISFSKLGTLPLSSETFSTIAPTDAASGIATGKTQASYAFTINGSSGLPLWQAARLNQNLGAAHVKLPSVEYDFRNSVISDISVSFDAQGATIVAGKLAFQTVSLSTSAAPSTVATGPLSLTYTGQRTGLHAGNLSSAAIMFSRTISSATAGIDIVVSGDAVAPLVEASLDHENLSSMKIATASTTISLTNATVKSTTQTGTTTLVSIEFQKLTIADGGKNWIANFGVGGGGAGSGIALTSSDATTSAVPYLTSPTIGTIPLAAESISQQSPTDAATGLSTGKSILSGEMISTSGSAILIFEALGQNSLTRGTLTTATGAFDLSEILDKDMKLSFDASGVAKTQARMSIGKLSILTKASRS